MSGRAEQIVYLTEWAARYGATLQINGQVGFGRDCVGILVSDQYVDTDVQSTTAPWWQPENAYHKHDCLAVLGHGDEPLRELYDWVRWLDEHGYKIETEARRPENQLDLMIHGITRPYLTKDAVARVANAPVGGREDAGMRKEPSRQSGD